MTILWSFGGTALSDFGTITVVSDYLDLPERRGENITIPHRHGKIFVPKYYDERRITIGIGINAVDVEDLENTIDTLRALLAPRRQQTLSQTRPDASVYNAQATADMPLQIERFGPRIVKLLIEFVLPFPFFRSSVLTDDSIITVSGNPLDWDVNNPGTVEECDPTIVLTGPLENVVITNTENGHVLTYTGIIDSGDTVTIQTAASGEYTAVHSVDGNVIGNVSHSGSASLMVFEPGNNDLTIESDVTTTGTVKATFYAPFM